MSFQKGLKLRSVCQKTYIVYIPEFYPLYRPSPVKIGKPSGQFPQAQPKPLIFTRDRDQVKQTCKKIQLDVNFVVVQFFFLRVSKVSSIVPVKKKLQTPALVVFKPLIQIPLPLSKILRGALLPISRNHLPKLNFTNLPIFVSH